MEKVALERLQVKEDNSGDVLCWISPLSKRCVLRYWRSLKNLGLDLSLNPSLLDTS